LKRDVLRDKPGGLLVKKEKKKGEAEEDAATEDAEGKSIDDYFAKAKDWKKYGDKAYESLKKRKDNAEAIAKGEKPKASKEAAVADAKKLGYLKAAADLVADRPAWLIHQIEIDNVEPGAGLPPQKFQGSEVSSHPELNGQPTTLVMTPAGASEPTARIVLRFDDPAAQHELFANMKNVEIGDSIKVGDSLKIESGKADISANGNFSTDTIDIPFTLLVRDLKTDNEMLNNLKQTELPGRLYGSLLSPRVKIDLNDQLKDAVVGAAKEKAKEEARKAANKELDKTLQSEEAEEMKSKATDALKKLF
ncbi:MAG: hypothetical protein U9P12_09460, partial [Verrucomicrobiota bacterium]|nr:hypothetical protein [Verrucomicrobiota bacterium]